MKTFMLWHGGSSYAAPTTEDTETFYTLSDAIDAFSCRTNDSYYPCVSDTVPDEGGPEAWIFFSDPRKTGADYPDRIMFFGPRGGVNVVRA